MTTSETKVPAGNAQDRRVRRGLAVLCLLAATGAGVAALVLSALEESLLGLVPSTLSEIGATVVATTYSFALAARTGGRPFVFGGLAGAIGLATVLSDLDTLRTGAAVLTCVVAALLGLVATVPAATVWQAVREVLLALSVSAVGAAAAIGFEPLLAIDRFRYAIFALALASVLLLAFHLGGRHGLGRRGLFVVLVGAASLAFVLAYAELLRDYGDTWVVARLSELAEWSRGTLGAFPEPLQALVGVPALMWGVHMRARRRQGWWVCAFGVTALVPLGYLLAQPGWDLVDVGLTELYALAVGVPLGVLLIRADAAWLGSRGRRADRVGPADAGRLEPRRSRALI